eukprot:PhM_4_TR16985/c0_g1_i1/m.41090/K11426/SMYD; SET and MYND domain-containing protein
MSRRLQAVSLPYMRAATSMTANVSNTANTLLRPSYRCTSAAASQDSQDDAANAQAAQCLVREVTDVLATHTDVVDVRKLLLYRARAYLALGCPHLALADCITLADTTDTPDVLRLDDTADLSRACFREMHRDKDAIVRHVAAPTAEPITDGLVLDAVRVATTGYGGRGLEAVKALEEGAVVVERRDPIVTYPTKAGTCSHCLREVPLSRTLPCRNVECHEEYCSKQCREDASAKHHSKVCKLNGYRTLELELYSSSVADFGPGVEHQSQSILAAMRWWVMEGPNAGASFHGSIPLNPDAVVTGVSVWYQRLMRAVHPEEPNKVQLSTFLDVIARVASNAFTGPRGIEVHGARSLLNHSCSPNCMVTPKGDVVTTRPVAAGEECTIHYYPHLSSLEPLDRYQEIQKRGFKCGCVVCRRLNVQDDGAEVPKKA